MAVHEALSRLGERLRASSDEEAQRSFVSLLDALAHELSDFLGAWELERTTLGQICDALEREAGEANLGGVQEQTRDLADILDNLDSIRRVVRDLTAAVRVQRATWPNGSDTNPSG